MAANDFVNRTEWGSGTVAEDAHYSVLATYRRDRKSTETLLKEALAREVVLRQQRDRLLQQREKLLAGREDAASRVGNLTSRQRQIMELILLGHRNKRIASEVSLSQRTVESHRAAIMKKMGARCLPELTQLVLAASLV